MNPSGGLIYHLRARLHRRSWREARRKLEPWGLEILLRHAPRTPIVLVGPSGGYLIPDSWLRDRPVFAWDIDPWAEAFFRREHRGIRLEWVVSDFFFELASAAKDREPNRVAAELKHRHGIPENAIWMFTNLLGQLEFLDEDYPRIQARLAAAFAGKSAYSFHDRWSVPRGRVRRLPDLARTFTHRAGPEEVLGTLVEGGDPLEIEEHDTDALFSGAPSGREFSYVFWSLKRNRMQVLEATTL